MNGSQSVLFMLILSLPVAAAERPIVIAHRGASGYRPEHTIAAYQLAIDQHADFIEPDLVPTRDGVLIARHDNLLDLTTNVATVAKSDPEIAALKTTKVVNGEELSGWFSEDFTLAQIRRLKARERRRGDPPVPFRPANTRYDDRYPIPTFGEVVDLAIRHHVGIYPETKLPAYFAVTTGLNTSQIVLDVLAEKGIRTNNDLPTYIQSFEAGNLHWLRAEMKRRNMEFRLIQLLGRGESFDRMATREGLAGIATYADGVGPEKYRFILPRDDQDEAHLENATSFVADAHAAGLVVHPFTFRAENRELPANFRRGDPAAAFDLGDAGGEIRLFLATGIDGLFIDQPDLGVAAVRSPVATADDAATE